MNRKSGENIIYQLFLDYQKNKNKYCLWRWCTTCGNYKIRDKLFLRTIDQLKIDFKETNMEKGFLSLNNIRDPDLYNKVVGHILKTLNDLSDHEIDNILGPRPFYTIDENKDDFMKFIIMEIYSSLGNWHPKRDDVVSHLKSKVSNKKISRVINNMNTRYEKHFLNSVGV